MTEMSEDKKEYLTVSIGGQMFGVPVLLIEDVLLKQNVTPIPLAPDEISGSLNLRGRIVTAINMRKRLNILNSKDENKEMNVVVEHGNELYSLIVDNVGDVLTLSDETYEKNPVTMEEDWQTISSGVHRLKEQLLMLVDVAGLLKSFEERQSESA